MPPIFVRMDKGINSPLRRVSGRSIRAVLAMCKTLDALRGNRSGTKPIYHEIDCKHAATNAAQIFLLRSFSLVYRHWWCGLHRQ